ncbi:SDR family NAD(P)-dependent oxidoreductase [Streptodolium elevatio]|uniref:SDR family NAD(P)-dependent oxidoreductase n=1 Tax=Streptodolium elevatio TaxID=3157996 RepID=A0ABV3DLM8_9ACTN
MDELAFDGRVAVVTGAGGGLGRAYALHLARHGARVVVNDIGGDIRGAREGADAGDGDVGSPAREVVAEIVAAGGEAVANTDTVATREGGEAIVATALDTWGRIDIVVNNAGVAPSGAGVDTLGEEEYRRVLGTHLDGAFHVTGPAWRHMRAAGYGRVVNTCSGSVFGMPFVLPYATAKSGIIGFTRVLGIEGAPDGIKVNAVLPVAWTRMTASGFEQVYDAKFGPEGASPFRAAFRAGQTAACVGLLAHELAPCTGELFSVGAGRVARVVLGVTPGLHRADGEAAEAPMRALLDGFETVMDTGGLAVPTDSFDELSYFRR